MFPHRARRGEAGETLVEVLVAIAILGLAAVAILAGLQLSVKSSDIHRKEATGGSYVRSLAEAVQNYVSASPTNYKSCASANYYTSKAALTLPTGYVPSETAAQVWTGSTWASCGSDKGVQRVMLTVTSPGDATHTAAEKLYLVVRKACSGPVGSPC